MENEKQALCFGLSSVFCLLHSATPLPAAGQFITPLFFPPRSLPTPEPIMPGDIQA